MLRQIRQIADLMKSATKFVEFIKSAELNEKNKNEMK